VRGQQHCQQGSGNQAEASQPASQELPAALQPHLEGARRTPQLLGGLVASTARQVAQLQRGSIFLRQALECFVQCQAQVIPSAPVLGRRRPGRRRLLFRLPPLPDRRPEFHRQVIGHLVKPGGQGVALPDAVCFASQDEKRGLESVLRVVVVAQHPPANGQDQGPVPLHQAGERRSVVGGDKALKQVRIEPAPVRRRRRPAELAQGLAQRSSLHRPYLR
jgi:hypothetical protein